MIEKPLLFTGCSSMLIMPCHWSPSASHPTLPREAENFSRGNKYPKDVPVPAFLAYLQPVYSLILD